MSKKKRHHQVKTFPFPSYNQSESNPPPQGKQQDRPFSSSGEPASIPRLYLTPLAAGGGKDSHGPAVLASRTPPPQLFPADVRIFCAGNRPRYLFSIPEWEARDRRKSGELKFLRTSVKIRGMQLVEQTLQRVQIEKCRDGMRFHEPYATLEQIEGLPVVGPAIRLFYQPVETKQHPPRGFLKRQEPIKMAEPCKKAA